MGRRASVHGMMLWDIDGAEEAEIHAAIGAGLVTKMMRLVVGREFPLAEAPRAHEAVMKKGAFGKMVIVPSKVPE
jgi:NADPH2:quinone reductase